jgi:hypothetical protein
MNQLKSINYRGGIVTFSIPANWVEEYEPDGGGTFYDDAPDSGTLRLNVLSFDSDATPADQMAATVFRDGASGITASALPIRREEKTTVENGDMLHITKWEVAIPVLPRSLRLAVFSYTILLNQKSDPAFVREISLIEKSIREAHYSQHSFKV